MIKLNENDYYKVVKSINALKLNALFAQTVINHQIPGKVYVDNSDEPKTFYIAHPYGMSLLFGETNNVEFNSWLQKYLINLNNERTKAEWLQVYPDNWSHIIDKLLGDLIVDNNTIKNVSDCQSKIVKHRRINFNFDQIKYEKIKSCLKIESAQIDRTTAEMFDKIKGSVIPRFFWKDSRHFEKKGIGYSLVCDGEIASTAFAAFILEGKLEIGIETSEKFRGKGCAALVCSALIDYCLTNGLEPVWACRLENTASYNLAQKLGFVPTLEIPYYQLQV